MGQRSAAEGRFRIPSGWPSWALRCQAHQKRTGEQCKQWAIIGMPTCKFHGSGGEANRHTGQLRYMAWVITGGPQDAPVEAACRLALAVMFDYLLKQGKGSVEQQLKAALWLTEQLG